jgi:hypothetical protein
MRREQLLDEIARVDEEINQTIASAQLPRIDVRPFPYSIWIITAAFFAWYFFGDRLPGAYAQYLATADYARILGWICAAVAALATVNWMLRGRGYHSKNEAYLNASRRARELQERRRELQSELRAITGE